MSARDDLDRRLPAWFALDAPEREPEHLLGQVLAQTARTRRRPAWLIPERWIPMDVPTARIAAAPRIPWRMVGLAALLILALAVGALLVAGSQPRNLPAPFGPAANGLIAYAAEGDIYTLDLGTGRSTAIVEGPEADKDPVWSRDGTRLAFVRTVGRDGDQLYLARPDGSDARAITAVLESGVRQVRFSPDGREVMFVTGYTSKITIAEVDGSGVRTLDLPLASVADPEYRPPDGAQIVFAGTPNASVADATGIYIVNADGTGLHTLVKAARDASAGVPRWSRDGTRIAYALVDYTVRNWTVQTHVMAADGSGDRTLPAPGDAIWNFNATWSNDGTHLVIERGYSEFGPEDVVAAIVPADGSGPGVETARDLFVRGADAFEWAPDDSSILVLPANDAAQPVQPLVIDPATAEIRAQIGPWTTISQPSWQRIAP